MSEARQPEETQVPVEGAGEAPSTEGAGEAPSTEDDLAPVPGEVGSVEAPVDGLVSPLGDLTVEGLVDDLERLSHERDGYLESWRRTQADFENYKKRVTKQQQESAGRGAEMLVDKLLPVLDACDAAVRHGEAGVEPIFASLLGALEREGLERIDPAGQEFDPNVHEAVMHEPADEDGQGTIVIDVMRPGYLWKSRLLRPAMVKVKG